MQYATQYPEEAIADFALNQSLRDFVTKISSASAFDDMLHQGLPQTNSVRKRAAVGKSTQLGDDHLIASETGHSNADEQYKPLE